MRSKDEFQNFSKSVSQSNACFIGAALSLQRRHCASGMRSIKPTRSSTERCLETAGWLIAKGSANSPAEASPSISRARIARRVGSARQEKTWLSWSTY